MHIIFIWPRGPAGRAATAGCYHAWNLAITARTARWRDHIFPSQHPRLSPFQRGGWRTGARSRSRHRAIVVRGLFTNGSLLRAVTWRRQLSRTQHSTNTSQGFCLCHYVCFIRRAAYNSVLCGGVCWRFSPMEQLPCDAGTEWLVEREYWHEFPTHLKSISHFPLLIVTGVTLPSPTEFSPVQLLMIADWTWPALRTCKSFATKWKGEFSFLNILFFSLIVLYYCEGTINNLKPFPFK